MDRIPQDLLAKSVKGRRLGGDTLREALGDGPCLVSFLRHFG